ncbi:hypothetical protein TRFO_23955 [Tritrichomonas foetus]|uniref:Uncharacterized protein n=1 Tax=Tritrichomonas foetus TaxID=1144522 RepID=A0A1J4K8D4_9EUKA|nr:hypothetical protein TRFO_23955 [Tritrichomonas foetus]|eukprot:OHT07761.1 hypothetical protein TRFO_23955 [Tritrichomonas foetus]
MVEGNANIHMNQIMESNPEVEKISQNSSDYSSGYYSETDEFTDFANAIDKEFGQNFENSQISLQAEIPKEITNNKQDIESSLPESVLKTLDSFWLESDDSFFENESDIFSFDDYSQ